MVVLTTYRKSSSKLKEGNISYSFMNDKEGIADYFNKNQIYGEWRNSQISRLEP